MLASRSQAVLRPRMRASFQARFSSGIKLLNEKAKAEEDYYFSKQDEKLIKHMIQDSPDMVGGLEGAATGEPHTLSDKVKLVFMKNGIPPNAHPQLLEDLVKLLEAEPLLMMRRLFCTAPVVAAKPRVISFDLPVSIDSTRLTERERLRKKRLDSKSSHSIASSHALDDYFPTTLVSPQPIELSADLQVKVPNLWLTSPDPSIDDVGRFWRFPREELMALLPEGLAGETARDIFLMPSRSRDIGIMHRKVGQELVSQLSALEKGTCMQKRGWVLEGKRGTGKSSVMNTIVAWARRRKNWIVMFEPIGSRFGKEICPIVRSSCGIYLQNDLAKEFLERFIAFNAELVGELDVNKTIYGQTGIDGSPIEMVKRGYLPSIENSIKELPLAKRVEEFHKIGNQLKIASMKDKFPNPSRVLDICQFGIDNSSFATQAVAELINQLKVQDTYPVLIAVDEYNEMFVVSEYVSTRYDNTTFNGYIPNYHMALPRILSRWDGNEFKRGVKLFATTWSKRNRRQWNNGILGIKPEEIKQVRNFSPNEFEHYCAYQAITNTSHNFPKSKLDYFYMLTQGNGFETRKIMATLY